MFWKVVRQTAILGLKAGAVLGILYFPLFGLIVAPLLTVFQTGKFPSLADTSASPAVALIGSFVGAMFGMFLGTLNGLLFAFLLVFQQRFYLASSSYVTAIIGAAVNLIGMFCFSYLLFATDLFTNFGISPLSHAGPNHTINIISDKSTFLLLVVGPALVAAAAAFWASARLIEWYQDETSPPQNFPPYSDTPRSMDHLWPL